MSGQVASGVRLLEMVALNLSSIGIAMPGNLKREQDDLPTPGDKSSPGGKTIGIAIVCLLVAVAGFAVVLSFPYLMRHLTQLNGS